MVAMAELRKLFDEAGLGPAQTLLQSGNVVFGFTGSTPRKLEETLARVIVERFRMPVDCIVRSQRQLNKAIEGNPFPNEAKADPSHLLLCFLRSSPSPAAIDALTAAIPARERVSVNGDTAYLYYPDGVGNSRLSSNLIERKLDTRGTARNWNTVLKLMGIIKTL